MQILSTGSIYLDINTKLNGSYESIHPEKEYQSEHYELTLGGSAVIAPLTMAKLGLHPHFVGAVGKDDFGILINDKLKKSGIQAHLEISDTSLTNVGINRTDEVGQTFMDVLGNANSYLTSEILIKTVETEFEKLDLLYLGSVFKTPKLLDALISTAQKFRTHEKLVFLDHGRIPNDISDETRKTVLQDLMPHITHYAPSEQDIFSAWKLEDVNQFVSMIKQYHPYLITHLKMGQNGSILISKNRSTVFPPHSKINPKTRTNFVGAGDKSNAGFIYGLSKGMTLDESVITANKVAYLGITNQEINELAVS